MSLSIACAQSTVSVIESSRPRRYSWAVLLRLRFTPASKHPCAEALAVAAHLGIIRRRGSRGRGRAFRRSCANQIPVIGWRRWGRAATIDAASERKQTRPARYVVIVALQSTKPRASHVTRSSGAPPSLYVFNAAAITKPHAVEQLTADLGGYNLDIAMITETHLKAKHTSSSVAIDGYALFRRDRAGRRGGGVAMYVGTHLRATEWISVRNNLLFELLWIRITFVSNSAFIGVLYHPPKPIYEPADLLLYIGDCIEQITNTFPGDLIIMAGDMNTLPDQSILMVTGLTSIVDEPTRGLSKLDRLYVSDPCSYDNVKVVRSAVKSDHCAIIAYCGKAVVARGKTSTSIAYRKKSPNQNSLFMAHAGEVKFDTPDIFDVQASFDSFYDKALGLLNEYYPERLVSITSNEPYYMTPDIKAKLRQKNKLMRAGRVEEANVLAARIGTDIVRCNTAQFRCADADVDARDMWDKVRQLANRSGRSTAVTDVTAQMLNDHYASISQDNAYVNPARKFTANTSCAHLSVWQVFHTLDHLDHTATGLDNLPAWFLRLGSIFFAEPLTQLFNLSLSSSIIPTQWKRAYILPLAKVPQPTAPSDYRPISITPVLSRMLERFVVRQFIYPSLPSPPPGLHFADQFAFRPTGSTTAAVITILQRITALLESNPYVIVYALDFSKAFDTVRHCTLMEKMSKLQLPDCIYNWLIEFFTDHSHCTKHQGSVSTFETVNASVIQGSAIGPAAYLINAADLRPMISENDIEKFADDTYLLVAAKQVDTRQDEIRGVEAWAIRNNLRLNQAKSMEIIFTKPGRKIDPAALPPALPGITRVAEIKALGITLSNKLSVSAHVDATITSCAQSLFALKTLRSHGMNDSQLQTIFKSVALAKLRYASPAWYGFTNASDRERLEAFLRRAVRSGFLSQSGQTFAELCAEADGRLFDAVKSNNDHVLYPLLPAKTVKTHNLRPRPHDFVLPRRTSHLSDCNFIMRMLYKHE
jgi:Reverse transcriptase (RNA-dependent DNA polymerase)